MSEYTRVGMCYVICLCVCVCLSLFVCAHVCLHVCSSIQSFAHRQPEPISSDILDNMKMVQFVGYAPKPVGLHRNQCPYQLSKYQSNTKKTEPESPMMRGTDHARVQYM